MAKKKSNIDIENAKITDSQIESFARCLLPAIEKFFESEEGKREFEEWKTSQTRAEKEKE